MLKWNEAIRNAEVGQFWSTTSNRPEGDDEDYAMSKSKSK